MTNQSKNNHAAQLVHHQIAAEIYSGPLPSASEFLKYREAVPDAPEIILKMAVQEQESRLEEIKRESNRRDEYIILDKASIENEKSLLKINGDNTRLGLHYAFWLVIAILLAVCICAYLGHPIMGGIVGCGGLASLAAVFIIGARIKRIDVTKD